MVHRRLRPQPFEKSEKIAPAVIREIHGPVMDIFLEASRHSSSRSTTNDGMAEYVASQIVAKCKEREVEDEKKAAKIQAQRKLNPHGNVDQLLQTSQTSFNHRRL